ncbi:4055_t:CDS:1, partial [Racocetra persica]
KNDERTLKVPPKKTSKKHQRKEPVERATKSAVEPLKRARMRRMK